MFTLDLNYSASAKQGIAPFTTIENPSNNQYEIWQIALPLTDFFLPTSIVEAGDNYELEVAEGTETVTILKQGDALYKLGEDFSFDLDNLKITIAKSKLVYSLAEPIVYGAIVPTDTIKTTNICDVSLPVFLDEFNAVGTISYSRSFRSHPTANFEFYCCQSEETEVRDRLCNGTELNLFGIPLLVSSLSIVREKQNKILRVNVSLNGIYDARNTPSLSPLDEPCRKREIRNDFMNSFREVDLTQLANKVGLTYLGLAVSWWQRGKISIADVTTFREEIEGRIAGFSGYAFYSNSKGVEGRKWRKQKTHLLSSCEVRSEESISINGHGLKVDDVKLTKEYDRTLLQLDFPQLASNTERNQVITRYQFENTDSLAGLQTPTLETVRGNLDPPDSVLRNMSINFDQGGFTKTVHIFKEMNGQVLEQETQVFGYQVVSTDVYLFTEVDGIFEVNFVGTAPNVYWGLCKTTRKTFFYDDDGYLIREEMTGHQKARLKQESQQLEAINALIEAAKAADQEEIDNFQRLSEHYQFSNDLPIKETIDYHLERLRDYYNDIKLQQPISDWIEPMFLTKRERFFRESIVIDRSDYDKEKISRPAVISKTFREEERTIIISVDLPERFTRRKYVQNNEGEYAKNALRLINSSENIGRPGVHSRLPNRGLNRSYFTIFADNDRYRDKKIFLYTQEPEKDINISSPQTSFSSFATLPSNVNVDNYFKNVLIERDTISFSGVFNFDQAILAAQTQASIINSKEAETLDLDCLFRPEFEEGDFVLYKGKKYVIFNINATISIDMGKLRCDRFSLSLGRYVDPPVYYQIRDRFGYPVTNNFNVIYNS